MLNNPVPFVAADLFAGSLCAHLAFGFSSRESPNSVCSILVQWSSIRFSPVQFSSVQSTPIQSGPPELDFVRLNAINWKRAEGRGTRLS